MNLLAPFQYGFMQEALLTGALVGAVCAVLSCYLVLKGWSLMGDAISHAVLPGVVGAYMLGLPLAVGAFGSLIRPARKSPRRIVCMKRPRSVASTSSLPAVQRI